MKMSEEEFKELEKRMSKWRSAPPLPVKMDPVFKEAVKQAKKKSLTIVLPFKLPTWNQLLAAGVWERKKIRDRIHLAVLRSTAVGSDSVTPTEYQQRPLLTD